MERTPELFEKIDAYLNGILDKDELISFEQSMLLSPKLKDEVEKYELIKNTLSDTDTIRFRKKIEDIANEIENGKSIKSQSPLLKYWRVAAIFIALIGVSSILWFQHPVQKDLYSTYYVPYPMNEITRGKSTDVLLKEVAFDYKNKAYTKVIPALKSLVEKDHDNDELSLYLGNSYLNTGQEKNAIALFRDVNNESLFYKDAQWFLALSHLKLKQNDQAILVLEKLSSYESLYKKKALKLLEKLKSS